MADSIRSRHVHVLGATGSGKTESVILNFLKQDVSRGLGVIILDAKGDASFLSELNAHVPKEKLRVFDLSEEEGVSYDPLQNGNPMESAQRLFSSLTWSEEYYKSKALSALQAIYQYHFSKKKQNPQLKNIAYYLEDAARYGVTMAKNNEDTEAVKLAIKEFADLCTSPPKVVPALKVASGKL